MRLIRRAQEHSESIPYRTRRSSNWIESSSSSKRPFLRHTACEWTQRVTSSEWVTIP
jgi:hypothetical protein